ncbi:MAG: hypothetical protein JKX87_02075, partial [Cycloclasticus sp.]|nr:hypothetical protein [Cycloclasticus sp.]
MKTVAIGGVGGSGTRLVAEICKECGVFIGSNLNKSNDNLSFPNLKEIIYLSRMNEILKDEYA